MTTRENHHGALRPSSVPLVCVASMVEAFLDLNARLRTPPLPATHVGAGTDLDTSPKSGLPTAPPPRKLRKTFLGPVDPPATCT